MERRADEEGDHRLCGAGDEQRQRGLCTGGDRIATFDNDGTLWVEQPIYTEAIFTNDRIQQLAPQHPEWKTKQPFAAVLNHDRKALAASEEKGAVAQLLAVTHTGMTTDEFDKTVSDWIAQARHPRFKQPFTQCIYQPMVEVLNYLRANDSRRISSRAASRSS